MNDDDYDDDDKHDDYWSNNHNDDGGRASDNVGDVVLYCSCIQRALQDTRCLVASWTSIFLVLVRERKRRLPSTSPAPIRLPFRSYARVPVLFCEYTYWNCCSRFDLFACVFVCPNVDTCECILPLFLHLCTFIYPYR